MKVEEDPGVEEAEGEAEVPEGEDKVVGIIKEDTPEITGEDTGVTEVRIITYKLIYLFFSPYFSLSLSLFICRENVTQIDIFQISQVATATMDTTTEEVTVVATEDTITPVTVKVIIKVMVEAAAAAVDTVSFLIFNYYYYYYRIEEM